MSLLPQTMLSPSAPIGKTREDGSVLIEENWWLLLYNMAQQILGGGTSTGLPPYALIELGSTDSDANDTDAAALRQPVSNLGVQLWGLGETEVDAFALRSPLARALLLAQDSVLPDPIPQAQPVSSITVGASPYSYTAPFNGLVAITGGTVSAIDLIRQGTTVSTGITVGLIPVSRRDIVKITHTGAPTATFLPT